MLVRFSLWWPPVLVDVPARWPFSAIVAGSPVVPGTGRSASPAWERHQVQRPELVQLCRYRHRWTYADTATMPMCWFCVLVLVGSRLAVARHSYRLSRKASILSVGR